MGCFEIPSPFSSLFVSTTAGAQAVRCRMSSEKDLLEQIAKYACSCRCYSLLKLLLFLICG